MQHIRTPKPHFICQGWSGRPHLGPCSPFAHFPHVPHPRMRSATAHPYLPHLPHPRRRSTTARPATARATGPSLTLCSRSWRAHASASELTGMALQIGATDPSLTPWLRSWRAHASACEPTFVWFLSLVPSSALWYALLYACAERDTYRNFIASYNWWRLRYPHSISPLQCKSMLPAATTGVAHAQQLELCNTSCCSSCMYVCRTPPRPAILATASSAVHLKRRANVTG